MTIIAALTLILILFMTICLATQNLTNSFVRRLTLMIADVDKMRLLHLRPTATTLIGPNCARPLIISDVNMTNFTNLNRLNFNSHSINSI